MVEIMLLPSARLSLFCVTRTGRKRPLMMLSLMYTTLLPVFQAQRIIFEAAVTGYLRHDVFLPCKFIPGSTNDSVTQVQWGLQEPGQNETVILVSHQHHGVKVHDTFLKDKVAIQEQSLIIRDLAERDAGLYACRISAFPSGSISASIRLMVQEQTALSSAELAAAVTAVLSLFVLIATVSFVLIRRPDSSVRCCVRDDTRGHVATTDEAVLYSDVRIKPSADAAALSSDGCAETDDVTYSEVLVLCQKSKL